MCLRVANMKQPMMLKIIRLHRDIADVEGIISAQNATISLDCS